MLSNSRPYYIGLPRIPACLFTLAILGCGERVNDSVVSLSEVNTVIRGFGLPELPSSASIMQSRMINAQDPSHFYQVDFRESHNAEVWFQGVKEALGSSERVYDARKIDQFATGIPSWWPTPSKEDIGSVYQDRYFTVISLKGGTVWIYACEL